MAAHKTSQWINAYTAFVIRWRWLVVLLTIAVCVVFTSGVRNLGFNNDYRVFFSDENPHLQAFDQQQKIYTKNDNIIFSLTPYDGVVFSREALSAVEELTRRA